MEIQLIIRAPNQNFDDQVINCTLDWTVLTLKNHLSEVYPSRPAVQEQKLIYSGRLLLDHLQLKDIIRHEDMQSSVHILHLICKGNNYHSSPAVTPGSSQGSSSQSIPVHSSQLDRENIESSSENILRHRFNSPSTEMNNIQMQPQQIPVNTLPIFPMDPQAMAQMYAMQQMYAQYIAQYWQNVNMSGETGNYSIVFNNQTLQNNLSNAPHENVPHQHTNQRNNAPAAQPVEDNELVNRDWLDQLFLYFRFLILLWIVYFYTTPERFMLVIIVVVVAFLYHEGWFVRQGIADAVIGQRNRGQNELNPNAANNVNELRQVNENEGQDGHELEAAMDGEDPTHSQNPDVANNNNNNNNNHVFSPLTFLTTFFSSLIPEPPPPVNIN